MERAAWVGQSVERVEDAALLTGRGRYIDDLGVAAGHAACRHPALAARACATSLGIDARSRARPAGASRPSLTGDEVAALGQPVAGVVKAPIRAPIAIDRVRYVGEPVAVVVAADRYLAEDALDLIEVDYGRCRRWSIARAARSRDAPVLHRQRSARNRRQASAPSATAIRSAAFAAAAHRVAVDDALSAQYRARRWRPTASSRNTIRSRTPTTSWPISMGPFSLHAVMARALKVSGNRLRLRTPPDSGGSFGVKQGVFSLHRSDRAWRRAMTGRPGEVDRGPARASDASVVGDQPRRPRLDAAVEADGRITALRLRPDRGCAAPTSARPEPATLYRMHGNLTGAYDIRHSRVRNRVVVTNKTPTGLDRGFGGPQVYYALERLMQRIARELQLDPLDVIRRNLIPADAFPYRTATGALLDSGDYRPRLDRALRDGGLDELQRRGDEARAPRGSSTASALRPSSSRASPTWATSRPC